MRDIKFRIWDEKSKQILLVDQIDLTGDGGALVFDDDGNEFFFPDAPLMQFTGLLDAKGKEIWEGDIIELQCHDDEKCKHQRAEVKHYGDGWYFFTEESKGRMAEICSVYASQFHQQYDLNRCEVLGNIYENGDLLK